MNLLYKNPASLQVSLLSYTTQTRTSFAVNSIHPKHIPKKDFEKLLDCAADSCSQRHWKATFLKYLGPPLTSDLKILVVFLNRVLWHASYHLCYTLFLPESIAICAGTSTVAACCYPVCEQEYLSPVSASRQQRISSAICSSPGVLLTVRCVRGSLWKHLHEYSCYDR